jgi:hypothetical protein
MSDTEKPQITPINADGPVLPADAGCLSLDSGSHEWLRTGGCDDRFDITVVILRGIMTTL